MAIFKTGRQSRLCAFCGNEHRVYMKAHVSVFDVVLCTFAGILVLSPLVDAIDPRGIAIGAIFIGIAEIFVGLRHRISLKCARCGFDPIIYRKSQEQAANLVREHIAKRALNPANLLSDPVVAAGRRPSAVKARASNVKRRSPRVDSPQQPSR